MMFKKGSFEVDAPIYPVAIKYDPRFADPYWNTEKQSFVRHVFMLITSWAVVADVWYLPPMYRDHGESAVSFANRVKREIALRGGLVDLEWDGALKRRQVSPDLINRQQLHFSCSLTNLHEHDPENFREDSLNSGC